MPHASNNLGCGRCARVLLGVAGAAGHGKSTLADTLTKAARHMQLARFSMEGIDSVPEPTRWEPEEARCLDFWTEEGEVGLLDYPSGPHFTRALFANEVPDGALLVVSSHGVNSETEAQLRLLHDLGVRQAVVFLNFLHPDDRDLSPLLESEVRALLARTGFRPDAPVVHGSAVAAQKLRSTEADRAWELIGAVRGAISGAPPLEEQSLVFGVSGVYRMGGYDAVVQGHIQAGRLQPGQTVALLGPDFFTTARVLALSSIPQIHGVSIRLRKF